MSKSFHLQVTEVRYKVDLKVSKKCGNRCICNRNINNFSRGTAVHSQRRRRWWSFLVGPSWVYLSEIISDETWSKKFQACKTTKCFTILAQRSLPQFHISSIEICFASAFSIASSVAFSWKPFSGDLHMMIKLNVHCGHNYDKRSLLRQWGLLVNWVVRMRHAISKTAVIKPTKCYSVHICN